MAKKRTGYWYEREEEAVRKYLSEEDPEKRDKIYREVLEYPLSKMIESLIRRYRLYNPEMEEDKLQKDTLSFLITKFDKFKPSLGNKSYSYYGTVCKHYLMSQLLKSDKHMVRNIPYEDVSTKIEENPEHSYELEHEPQMEVSDFILKIVKEIQEEIDTNPKLKINELKVGYAVIDILENWETIFDNDDYDRGSNIYNKNRVLHILREMTFLTSKEIRNALKRYKVIYEILKKDIYEEE